MLRPLLRSILALVLVAGSLPAADEKPEKKDDASGVTGVIVKVDAKHHTILMRVKNADNKQVQKVFTFGNVCA